jgi:6-methylpretetramide 4-monooxygenase / 4-hydroxy-6-methylpretetramide 12a-monooxygenase
MREERTEVLVVGAGPVGLWTALLLAEAGVQVAIIDREERTAARSYACALHPRTLKLFQAIGLLRTVLEAGRRVQTVGFYEQSVRHADLNLPEAAGDFLLILPQDQLEKLLEQRLRESGVGVYWNHRFDDLTQEGDDVSVTIEELGGTGTGYIVPHWESGVKNRRTLRAQLVIGADGRQSLVRQRLGLDFQRTGESQVFAAFEFESDAAATEEVRIAMNDTTNVLWPLPGNKWRWSFQMLNDKGPPEFPEKERRAVRLSEPNVDERIRETVQRVARNRAPWFNANIQTVTWCTEVVFEPGLAKAFGQGRCWLAGDAAHQTGPAGVQSMNAGFREGKKLSELIPVILREQAPIDSLEEYGRENSLIWRQLLGLTGGLTAGRDTDAWIAAHRARLLPCLPATGPDIGALAQSLNLILAQNQLSTLPET